MRKTLVSFLGGLALVAAMALPAGAAPAPSFHHGGGGFHGGRGGWEHPGGPHRGYRPGHDHYRWGPGPGHPHYGPNCPPMSCPYGSF